MYATRPAGPTGGRPPSQSRLIRLAFLQSLGRSTTPIFIPPNPPLSGTPSTFATPHAVRGDLTRGRPSRAVMSAGQPGDTHDASADMDDVFADIPKTPNRL